MATYLIALELGPTSINQEYNGLPLHCTLMHWFRFDGDLTILQDTLKRTLSNQESVVLTGIRTMEYGPLSVMATTVQLTKSLTALHMQLYNVLNDLDVRHVEPTWVGEGFEAHVTKHGEAMLHPGESRACDAAFLAVAEGPEYRYPRKVIARFSLKRPA